MTNKDTLCLLKECDSGTKMAVSSIDEILDKAEDSKLKQLLSETKNHHEKLGNMKMGMDKSDATIADLMTDGCNMGIKYLHKYLNQYTAADSKAKDICKRLISIEETLRQDLRCYL